MANRNHWTLLDAGPAGRNDSWIKLPSARPTLDHAPLCGLTLFGVDLTGAKPHHAEFQTTGLFGVGLSARLYPGPMCGAQTWR